jgi:hypothetical protein
MDHPVTVGTQQPKIADLGFVPQSQGVNRRDVVALDKPFTVVSVSLTEVKPARLTC